jgi:hypothetical protein
LVQVPALLAVGLEGCWGLFLCSFLLPVTSIIHGPDGLPLDDAAAAFRAIWSNIELGGAVYLSIFSIAFFNFFGVSGEAGGQLMGNIHMAVHQLLLLMMITRVCCALKEMRTATCCFGCKCCPVGAGWRHLDLCCLGCCVVQ